MRVFPARCGACNPFFVEEVFMTFFGHYFTRGVVLFSLVLQIWGCGREETEKIERPARTVPGVSEQRKETVMDESMNPPVSGAGTDRTQVPGSNTPPRVTSVRLIPGLVYPGTKVKVEVEGEDREGDEITFRYRWKRNSEFLPDADSDELDTTGFKKGDLVAVMVIPFDGMMEGDPGISRTLVVANRPPRIESFPPTELRDGVFAYRVKAVDPDGDALTFSLEQSPPGMTIDPASGLVEWKVPGGW